MVISNEKGESSEDVKQWSDILTRRWNIWFHEMKDIVRDVLMKFELAKDGSRGFPAIPGCLRYNQVEKGKLFIVFSSRLNSLIPFLLFLQRESHLLSYCPPLSFSYSLSLSPAFPLLFLSLPVCLYDNIFLSSVFLILFLLFSFWILSKAFFFVSSWLTLQCLVSMYIYVSHRFHFHSSCANS